MWRAILLRTSKRYFNNGFTIVELLIVVVIIAVLAAITIVAYNGISKSANNSSIQSILSQAVHKLELYRADSPNSTLPLRLDDAGLSLVSTSDVRYVYARSADGKQYCLANSKAGRTYFVTNTSSKPQPGVCKNTVGTLGTGDVATDGPSNAYASIFGGATVGTSQAVFSDGGGSLRVGNRFYTYKPQGIRVIGLRIYNPATATSGFLTTPVTAYAYTNDWTGTTISASSTFSSAPVATKLFSTPRIAGNWTDILFDSSFVLPTVSASSGQNDVVTLAVQFNGGNDYVFITPSPNGSVDSIDKPGTFLAEYDNLGKGIHNIGAGNVVGSYYGIDMIFEEITP